MRLSTTTFFAALAALEVASARPACHFTSVLTSSPSAIRDLPVGKTPISKDDMAELGRLAIAVNPAYCPHVNRLQPHPANSLTLQSNDRRKRYQSGSRHATSIIATSEGVEKSEGAAAGDMRWYISHTPSTQTLTLSFSSLGSVDDLLELLASSPSHNSTVDPHLVQLPIDFFPAERSSDVPIPRMHHSFVRPLTAHGIPALRALLDLIDSPPMSAKSRADILHSYIAVLTGSRKAPSPLSTRPIRNVEIVGHGLGSAVGLIVAAALKLELSRDLAGSHYSSHSPLDISATLFGLPRVGDKHFADFIDQLVSTKTAESTFHFNRVTSYADTIVHLPERHQNLAHPSLGEIWIGADPRAAYACKSANEGMESEDCAASITLAKTSVLDHSGPFGGVWITPDSCLRL